MSDSFDAFRKKIKQRREGGSPPPEEEAAESQESDAGLKRGGLAKLGKAPGSGVSGGGASGDAAKPSDDDAGGGSALDRMRAARARLDAMKSKSSGEAAPAAPKTAGARALAAAKKAREEAKAEAPAASPKPAPAKPAPHRAGGGASLGAAASGDGFEAFRRQKENVSHEEAKRRAFEEGVEVVELDRSRLAGDRSERKSLEELGVERSRHIRTFRDIEEMDNPYLMETDEVSGERPAHYDTGRSERAAPAELGDLEKPAGFDDHRHKKKSAGEVEVEKPEHFQSHRYKRAKGAETEEDAEEKVQGFKRYEF